MVGFAWLPPETNSLRMYLGAGSRPLLAAAGAWDGLAEELHAHQGQGGAKSKGSQQEDEALYTEDRAWTEAVIGNRRRQDSKESK